MKIEQYKILIAQLPVLQQSYTTKRSTWGKVETELSVTTELSWIKKFNDDNFANPKKELTLNRQDIFDASGSIKELILKTIFWGYPGGARGNNILNMLKSIDELEHILIELKSIHNPTTDDFKEFVENARQISGLGLSTYSKFLYFLRIKFNGNESLILDQKLIDAFSKGVFDDFSQLRDINYDNAVGRYLEYLELIDRFANKLGTLGENIEMFLFLFGNILKSNDKI